MKHGTFQSYKNHRCRCDECREFMAAYDRDLRRRSRERFARGEIDAPHGTPNTYSRYGCRCRPCTDADVAKRTANRRRKAGWTPVEPLPARGAGMGVALARALQKVSLGDCWTWTGARSPEGYGMVATRLHGGPKRVQGAHRFVFEALVADVPDGHELDHLCRNRACVNPDHLEVVTPMENFLRGESPPAKAIRKKRRRMESAA